MTDRPPGSGCPAHLLPAPGRPRAVGYRKPASGPARPWSPDDQVMRGATLITALPGSPGGRAGKACSAGEGFGAGGLRTVNLWPAGGRLGFGSGVGGVGGAVVTGPEHEGLMAATMGPGAAVADGEAVTVRRPGRAGHGASVAGWVVWAVRL